MSSFKSYLLLLAVFFSFALPGFAQEQVMGYLVAAREYLAMDSSDLARKEIDSALVISPKNSMANSLMGDLLNDNAEYLKALMSYDKAIISNNSDSELFIKRAELHIRLNNHQAYILSDFEKAIALDQLNVGYYIKKASYLANSVNPTSLKTDYQRASITIGDALVIKHDDPYLLFLKSKYLFSDEQNLAALSDINKAITLVPYNDQYLAQRGYIYFMINNYQAAFIDYNAAINYNSQSATYFEFRGHSRYNLEEYKDAYDDYSKAIDLIIKDIQEKNTRISTNDPLNKKLRSILLYRGMSLVQNNQIYAGCDDFDRAYQMGEAKARNYMRQYCN